jgi:uncharacterized protein (DUF697 family)
MTAIDRKQATDAIIRKHVLWSVGAGLIPVPLIDIASVTAIQLDMLKDLAELYEVDYTQSSGKAFVSALASSTFAGFASSMLKALPFIGTIIGGLSMSVLCGGSTYALGQVAVKHFTSRRTLVQINIRKAKQAYEEALEKGKAYVNGLQEEHKEAAMDVCQALEKLSDLREKGILTDAEFDTKKKELLARL